MSRKRNKEEDSVDSVLPTSPTVATIHMSEIELKHANDALVSVALVLPETEEPKCTG